MAGIGVTGLVESFLVEGGGADGIDLSRLCQADGLLEAEEGGIPGGGRDLAELQNGRQQIQIEAVNCAWPVFGAVRRGKRPYGRFKADNSSGPFKYRAIADNNRIADVINSGVGQRLDDYLGPDSGRIAHGDTDNWFWHVLSRYRSRFG